MVDNSTPKEVSKTLSIIIPCFFEEKTLEKCIEKVREIADKYLDNLPTNETREISMYQGFLSR